MAGFINGAQEVSDLLEILASRVEAGVFVPVVECDDPLQISLGRGEIRGGWWILLQRDQAGGLSVLFRNSVPLDSERWSAAELGSVVDRLWWACRCRLYGPAYERAAAAIAAWLGSK